jgi:putative ABC transport system ATP-binding protein
LPIIETIDLKKTYQLGTIPVPALQGINLAINDAQFVAILGPSGCGKSTLLNMLGALDTPTTGRILLDGVDITPLNDNQRAEIRRTIGFVFQFQNLIPRLTARENVELPLSIIGINKRTRRERGRELLTEVGLKNRLNHKPAELSGGERQRVAIARALAAQPRFLLMDEPTGNIDSKTATEIISFVQTLNKTKGVTIVMVTHNPALADYADKRIYMLDGRITANSS